MTHRQNLPHRQNPTHTDDLKLMAFDSEDLAVFSAQLQDAELRVGHIAFLPSQKRFAFVAERLDRQSVPPFRKSTGVHFEGVTQARHQNIMPNQSDQTLHLLAVTFTPGTAPAGQVVLHCTQGQLIKLDVEFLEAALADLAGDSKEI